MPKNFDQKPFGTSGDDAWDGDPTHERPEPENKPELKENIEDNNQIEKGNSIQDYERGIENEWAKENSKHISEEFKNFVIERRSYRLLNEAVEQNDIEGIKEHVFGENGLGKSLKELRIKTSFGPISKLTSARKIILQEAENWHQHALNSYDLLYDATQYGEGDKVIKKEASNLLNSTFALFLDLENMIPDTEYYTHIDKALANIQSELIKADESDPSTETLKNIQGRLNYDKKNRKFDRQDVISRKEEIFKDRQIARERQERNQR